MVAGLICLTVAGNSWQNYNRFQQYLNRQTQDSVEQQAKAASEEISNIVENWLSQISVVVPNLAGVSKESALKQIENLVNSNKEFVAFEVLSLPANTDIRKLDTKSFSSLGFYFTARTDDARFEQQETNKIAEKMDAINRKWLVQRISKENRGNMFIGSLYDQHKLPVLNIAYKFSFAQSKETAWAILTTWQTRITGALPNNTDRGKILNQGIVINQHGNIIASPNAQDMMSKKSIKSLPLAADALSGKMTSGIKANYRDQHGQFWIGAFKRLPQLDKITVLIQKDAESASLSTKKTIRRTALWGSLFVLIAVMFSFFLAAGITKALRELTEATFKIAQGNFAIAVRPKTADEVGVLSIAINNMSHKILLLLKEQVQKARVEKELETAKMVQDTFFPKRDIRKGPIYVTGFHKSASETGGDLWGHFSGNDDLEYLFVADAMGHGAAAALVTAIGYSTCMATADILINSAQMKISPARILERLNRVIYDAVQGGTTMTYFVASLDTKTGLMTYANAGHNFPFIIPSQADDPRIKKVEKKASLTPSGPQIKPILISLKGNPLGVEREAVYQEKTLQLAPGDKIIFYTDGLIECLSPQGRKISRKDLIEQAVSLADYSAQDMKNVIIDKVFKFFNNRTLIDDVTLVVAEIDKGWNVNSATKIPPPPSFSLQKSA